MPSSAPCVSLLAAHRQRRAHFIALGATATDHGHPSAVTADLSPGECTALLSLVLSKRGDAEDNEMFRAQMLTEMARMSMEDGLVKVDYVIRTGPAGKAGLKNGDIITKLKS